MSRSKTKPFPQPDEYSCGPASLKTALEILGTHRSFSSISRLCRVTKNGTPVKKLITVANKLGVAVLAVEWATLRHLQSALKPQASQPRAVIVDYLYHDTEPVENTGHYAAVASYSARNSRIYLLDSHSQTRKSYAWKNFLDRWYDYDYKRTKTSKPQKYRISRKWYNRLMLVLARDPRHLPRFRTPTAKLFLPA